MLDYRGHLAPHTAGYSMIISLLQTAWAANLRAAGRAERTIRSYVEALDQFRARLGNDATIDQITTKAIREYQRTYGQTRAPKTVALSLTAIRSFCRFVVEAEYRSDDPTMRVQFPKIPKKLPNRAITLAQARQLVTAIRVPIGLSPCQHWIWTRNRLIVLLMLYAGLRRAEAAALVWREVEIERATLTVRDGKGGKDRTIPIHPVLLVALRLAASERGALAHHAVAGTQSGRPMAAKSVSHIFDRWVPTLGLDFEITAHQLRHSFCTGLIHGGASLFDVQELMGHDDPKTTRRYYTLVGDHLRGAIERLPAW